MATDLNQLQKAIEIRNNLLDVLTGRSKENHDSYSIGDRSISKMSLEEIRTEYRHWYNIVKKMEKEHAMSKKIGVSGGIRIRG